MDNDTSSEETINFFLLEEDIYNNLKIIWKEILNGTKFILQSTNGLILI